MTETKPNLTLAAIRALQPGQAIRDHVVTGLQARRQAARVTFDLYYRAHSGARRQLKLGDWPSLTLELARDAAREILRRVAVGEDPAAKKQEARGAKTINDLCDEWLKRMAPPAKKPRSYKEDQYNIRNHIRPHLGKLHVATVSSADLKPVLDKIARGWDEVSERNGQRVTRRRGGAVAMRSVRTLLSGMFGLAMIDELKWRPEGSNPVSFIPRPKIAKRRVFVRPDQFKPLNDALEGLRAEWPYHVGCIFVALYCGTRITELATAKRAWIHGRTLILDEHKTDRTGDDRLIRLSEPALAEIERLPEHPNGFLFGDLGAMNEDEKDSARRSVHYVFDMARTAAGCPDIRPQDLRRTFASVARSNAYSLAQIGDLFSHKNPSTTDGYAWLFDDKAQEIADDVGNRIAELTKGEGHD